MSTVPQWLELCADHGSDVFIHIDGSAVPCPCRTPEGSRDPLWHLENPSAPVCNAVGMLPQPGTTTQATVKGFVQPIQSTRATRLSREVLEEMFGEIQQDDHIALLPVEWASVLFDFYDWGQGTEDWIQYNGRKFTIANANLIPDPEDGNPWHHWELGLRLTHR